jgi:hypothetical protein
MNMVEELAIDGIAAEVVEREGGKSIERKEIASREAADV